MPNKHLARGAPGYAARRAPHPRTGTRRCNGRLAHAVPPVGAVMGVGVQRRRTLGEGANRFCAPPGLEPLRPRPPPGAHVDLAAARVRAAGRQQG
eukprot:6016252-Pyramimonas_sp.AAC.1